MPIPKEVLDVIRPKNTVVIAYGKDKNLYAVRKRVGCRNDNGRHLPVNGPTIGHIIDLKYIPINDAEPADVSLSPIDLKDWANIVLCDRLFKGIQEELFAVYSRPDAMKIYCISVLRVCNPGIKDNELKEAYETSFLSELYPDIALSKNTVSTFLNDLGKTCSRIMQFMRNRTAAVAMDHHLLVDGTLKSDESKVNSLSEFSRKARTKGTRETYHSCTLSTWREWNLYARNASPAICWILHPTVHSSRRITSQKELLSPIRAFLNLLLMISLRLIQICIT